MKAKNVSLLLLLLPLTVTPSVAAQTPEVIRLTLDEAIARGFDASHRIGELRARQEAAEAVTAGRQLTERPQVGLLGSYTRTNHIEEFGLAMGPLGERRIIFPDIPDNYRARLNLQWPIYTAGRAEATLQAARAEAAAASSDVSAGRADLRLEIARTYWALSTAIETVKVVEEANRRADANLADIRSRFDAGLVPPNDVSSMQAERARQEMLAIQARNSRDMTMAELRRLIGAGPDTTLETVALQEGTAEPPAAPLSVLIDQAKRARADRQALEQRIEAMAGRRLAVERSLRPTLAVNGGVDLARPNQRILPPLEEWRSSWDVSLNMNWLLWDSGRTKAEVAEVVAQERALRERLLELDAMIEVDVRQRLLDIASNRAAVTASAEGITAAADARRVVGERFGVGVSTSTEVLDAQVALLSAELERTRALANLRLAEARLDRAIGR